MRSLNRRHAELLMTAAIVFGALGGRAASEPVRPRVPPAIGARAVESGGGQHTAPDQPLSKPSPGP